MEHKKIELHPELGQMVASLAGKHGMSLTAAVRELFANSLDAKAKKILFAYHRRRHTIEIIDDGIGTNRTEDIITPFRRSDHPSTGIGHWGIGGTVSQVWLTEAKGKSSVVSTTREFINSIVGDFDAMVRSGRLDAMQGTEPNRERQPTGTRIVLSHVRELAPQHFGQARGQLQFTFAPALRRGIEMGFELDGDLKPWSPYKVPAYDGRPIKKEFEHEGGLFRISGGITKQGEPNPVKGWVIGKGHQFIKTFDEPAGSEPGDLGRLHYEVTAPKSYNNFNDLKDGFVSDDPDLMAKLAGICEPDIKKVRELTDSWEIEAPIRFAQEKLDELMGHGKRGKRPGLGGKKGSAKPTGKGTPHSRFTESQDGPKSGKSKPRIVPHWTSAQMDDPFEIRPSASIINVFLSKDHPFNAPYKGNNAGVFLFQFIVAIVNADAMIREHSYNGLLPSFSAQSFPARFGEFLGLIKSPDRAA